MGEEEPRTIVSGLVKYVLIEVMQARTYPFKPQPTIRKAGRFRLGACDVEATFGLSRFLQYFCWLKSEIPMVNKCFGFSGPQRGGSLQPKTAEHAGCEI